MKTKQSGANARKADLAAMPSPNGGLDLVKLKKAGYPSLTYYNSIRSMTRFRMAWLRYKHPAWGLNEIVADVLKWYAKEVPQAVRRDLKKFMQEEWERKSWLEINAPSFDVLFEEKVQA